MKIHQRSYQNPLNLQAIGALIRRAYALGPYLYSWSFSHYDIWLQRKLGNQEVLGITGWQQDIRLREDKPTGFVGAAAFRDPHLVTFTVLPEYLDLLTPMLDWVESRFLEAGIGDKQLTIKTIATNTDLEDLLNTRNYENDSGHYIFREKDLATSPTEPVTLPPCFTLKHIETPNDLKKFHRGIELVFNFPDNPDVYQILQQTPSFVPELDLLLLSPDGGIASFASVWFDKDLSLAEFELVGTESKLRKLGLGSALIAEASDHLRVLGCRKATVMS